MKGPTGAAAFLKETAEETGKILMRYFTKVRRIEKKAGAGIVTEADKFAEDFILKKISRKFPGSSIITEESGEYKREGSLCFVIDPLDGTSNYAHGFPWFCVSIALYQDGEPFAGVIFQPVTREMFFAQKGKGTRLNGRLVHVTKEKEISNSLLGTGFYYSNGQRLTEEMAIFHRVNEVALGVRRPGAAALDLAFVAAGRYEGFWERGLSPWDVAAGFLMVEEAGGKVTDYRGNATDLHQRECLATNGRIHSQILDLVSGTA